VLGLDLQGVEGIAEDRRTMPGGEVGKGVIGMTDIDGNGIAGIEEQYDDVLVGTDGEQTRVHDRRGRSLPGTEAVTTAPVPGDDVVLTLDRSVQYTVEQALLAQVNDLGARGGTAIVMSTKTGEIIAMASVRRNDDGVVEVTSGNFAAVDAYEPGSVVKAATIAAALNEGTVTPDTTLEVPWQQQFSDTMLHDAEQHPTEGWTVSKILTESSNIGTIKTMLSMGSTLRETKEKQYSYLRAFGLGEATPLDLPGESNGIMKDWKKWEGAEQYTVAYGQGLASTSIQLVTAINVLANGGVYVAPKLVKATIGPDGTETETAPSATHRVVSGLVASEVNTMLRNVVCNGTATRAKVDGVTIAGKTGTGLKAQPGGGYVNDKGERTYYASFVGFFPAEDPEATVLVSIDEPPADQLTRFGGTAAAPVFARIAPSIMHELDITPPAAGGGCPKS
jgi:cell division protein FtsI (penicillin-binding protein 3)